MTTLPTELLLRIFVFAAPVCCRSRNEMDLTREEEKENYIYEEPEIKHMRDARRFPYCFADVCQRWRGIAQNNSQWWSCIRVFMDVGTPASIVSRLSSQIELTKHIRPIQIFILNRDEEVVNEPDAEGSLIKEIMTVTIPHMARVKRFVIESTHGSSLPVVSSGVFSNLGTLCLNLTLACKSYPNTQSYPAPGVLPHLPLGALHPKKLNLTLDGPTFFDFCSAAEYWNSKCLQRPNVSLKISHLKTDNGFTEHDLANAIFRMKNVTSLSLEKVEVPGSKDRDGILQFLRQKKLQGVTLASMTPTSMLRFFVTDDSEEDSSDSEDSEGGGEEGNRHYDLHHLELNNCNLTTPKYPKTNYLTLRNMPANQNYTAALREMEIDSLGIFDCPSIDDNILDILDEHGYYVDSLSIIGKTKITMKRLKKFIKYRVEDGCKPPNDSEAGVVTEIEGFYWKENVDSGFLCIIRNLKISMAEMRLIKQDYQAIYDLFNSWVMVEVRVDRLKKTVTWSDSSDDNIYWPAFLHLLECN